MRTLEIGDLARWDGIGHHFQVEPQVVRIAAVHDGPPASYDFHFAAAHPHPDGSVPVRGFARHVSPEHLSPAPHEG